MSNTNLVIPGKIVNLLIHYKGDIGISYGDGFLAFSNDSFLAYTYPQDSNFQVDDNSFEIPEKCNFYSFDSSIFRYKGLTKIQIKEPEDSSNYVMAIFHNDVWKSGIIKLYKFPYRIPGGPIEGFKLHASRMNNSNVISVQIPEASYGGIIGPNTYIISNNVLYYQYNKINVPNIDKWYIIQDSVNSSDGKYDSAYLSIDSIVPNKNSRLIVQTSIEENGQQWIIEKYYQVIPSSGKLPEANTSESIGEINISEIAPLKKYIDSDVEFYINKQGKQVMVNSYGTINTNLWYNNKIGISSWSPNKLNEFLNKVIDAHKIYQTRVEELEYKKKTGVKLNDKEINIINNYNENIIPIYMSNGKDCYICQTPYNRIILPSAQN